MAGLPNISGTLGNIYIIETLKQGTVVLKHTLVLLQAIQEQLK